MQPTDNIKLHLDAIPGQYLAPELLQVILDYVSEYRALFAFTIFTNYYLSIVDQEQPPPPPPEMIKDLIHAIHIRKSPWSCQVCKTQNNRLRKSNTFLNINIRACKKTCLPLLVVSTEYLNSHFIDPEEMNVDKYKLVFSRRQVEAAIGCKIEHYVREKLREVFVQEYKLQDDVYSESQECLESYFVPGSITFSNAKTRFLDHVFKSRARRLVLCTFPDYQNRKKLLEYFNTEIIASGANQKLSKIFESPETMREFLNMKEVDVANKTLKKMSSHLNMISIQSMEEYEARVQFLKTYGKYWEKKQSEFDIFCYKVQKLVSRDVIDKSGYFVDFPDVTISTPAAYTEYKKRTLRLFRQKCAEKFKEWTQPWEAVRLRCINHRRDVDTPFGTGFDFQDDQPPENIEQLEAFRKRYDAIYI